MALNPDVQKKAQAEVDYVVGTERLPTLSDRGRLPYIEALMKELLRWNTVAPTGIARHMLSQVDCVTHGFTGAGIPHRLTKDDTYCDYFLPEGSIILANIQRVD